MKQSPPINANREHLDDVLPGSPFEDPRVYDQRILELDNMYSLGPYSGVPTRPFGGVSVLHESDPSR
jgi:hypothetical protein